MLPTAHMTTGQEGIAALISLFFTSINLQAALSRRPGLQLLPRPTRLAQEFAHGLGERNGRGGWHHNSMAFGTVRGRRAQGGKLLLSFVGLPRAQLKVLWEVFLSIVEYLSRCVRNPRKRAPSETRHRDMVYVGQLDLGTRGSRHLGPCHPKLIKNLLLFFPLCWPSPLDCLVVEEASLPSTMQLRR